LRRRSARLRHEEAEPCKSLHEGDEVRETIKRRRFVRGLNYFIFTSSILLTDVTKNALEVTNFLYNLCRVSLRLSARFDIQEPHVTETSNADDARFVETKIKKFLHPVDR